MPCASPYLPHPGLCKSLLGSTAVFRFNRCLKVYSKMVLSSVISFLLFGTSLFASQTVFSSSQSSASTSPQHNVLWIFVDDMSAPFSCYGEKAIQTPNIDRLAREGTKFTRAFLTASVCSPSRSALITGCYQTSIGAHQHRSGRGTEKIHLPEGIEPVPLLFQRAGYFTAIGDPQHQNLGKTDYNFEWPRTMYNGREWTERRTGQPFFAQIMLNGGKSRHAKNWKERALKELGSLTPATRVNLPPTYPRDPVLLEDWADYLDTARLVDKQVGEIIARLETQKELNNTVIFFLCDNGISHARAKQFLYDEGMHTPLIVRGPGIAAGKTRSDLVSHIDIAPTSLAVAKISIPIKIQGRNFLRRGFKRDAVFAARDRCDETVDRIRAVRTDRYKYIRNYFPARPYLQPNHYKDAKPIIQQMRKLYMEGKLDPVQSMVFASTRPPEELYDVVNDPWETKNLALDLRYSKRLASMRSKLDAWVLESGDKGVESDAMFESDMVVYLKELENNPKARSVFTENLSLMRRWASEGK